MLSRFTGFRRDYEGSPCAAYIKSDAIWFGVSPLSTQLFAKEFVTGIEPRLGQFAAYPERDVVMHGAINDTVGELDLVLAAEPESGTVAAAFALRIDGRALTFALGGGLLADQDTRSTWNLTGLAIDGQLERRQLEPV